MISTKTLFAAACLAGLMGAPASAHHEFGKPRHFLAFWGGYRAPTPAEAQDGASPDQRFWKQAFFSIHSQGAGSCVTP